MRTDPLNNKELVCMRTKDTREYDGSSSVTTVNNGGQQQHSAQSGQEYSGGDQQW